MTCPICGGTVHPAAAKQYSNCCSVLCGEVADARQDATQARQLTEEWGRDAMRMTQAIQAAIAALEAGQNLAALDRLRDSIDQTKRPPAFPMPWPYRRDV